MNRLRTALVCIGLSLALYAVAGGADGLIALYWARSWTEAVTGWACRLPHAAPFALIGLAIGAFLITLGRKA